MVRILKKRIPGVPGGKASSLERFTGSRAPKDGGTVRGIRRLMVIDPAKSSGLIGTAKDILNLGRVKPATPATLTTALAGNDNDLKYTSKAQGTGPNAITITYAVAGANTPLTIGVVGNAITVNVATSAGSAATSTAAQVRTAVLASVPAMALLGSVDLAPGNDGSGVVTALSATNLTGGAVAVTTEAKVVNTVGDSNPTIMGSQRSSGTLPRGVRGVGMSHPNRGLRKR